MIVCISMNKTALDGLGKIAHGEKTFGMKLCCNVWNCSSNV